MIIIFFFISEDHRSPTNRRDTIYKKESPHPTRQLFKYSSNHDTHISTFISTSNDCFSFPAPNESPIRASSLTNTSSLLSSNYDNDEIRVTGRRNKSANDCQYNKSNLYKNNKYDSNNDNNNNNGTDYGKYTIPTVGPRPRSNYCHNCLK